ncbi:MAG: alkaline shock response membrane anchor protein AmaP [Clostridia bacterium]|nr:alkaline shock response membrane anchor protein AmaP [Clostridia bacterium]
MNLLEKILAIVLAVLMALLGIAAVIGIIWLPFHAADVQSIYESLTRPGIILLVCFIAVVLSALGVGFLVVLFRKKEPTRIAISKGEGGSTYLTVSALKTIVTRYLAMKGVLNESRTTVLSADGGVDLEIRIVVKSGMMLPMVAEQLQNDVRSYLETTTGIAVKNVSIVVVAEAAEENAKKTRVQ